MINYDPYVGRNSIGKDDSNCIKCAFWVTMFLTYDDIKVEKQYSRDMITESFIWFWWCFHFAIEDLIGERFLLSCTYEWWSRNVDLKLDFYVYWLWIHFQNVVGRKIEFLVHSLCFRFGSFWQVIVLDELVIHVVNLSRYFLGNQDVTKVTY